MNAKSKSNNNVVDVSLGETAVTSKTAAKILISVVEFLLYNWNQIPLVFEQFRFMIEKFTEAKNTTELDAMVKNYKIERQRNEAIQVYQKYKQFSDIIHKSFANSTIEQAIITMGSTKFTSKACFEINFPKFSTTDTHIDSARTIQRQIIMSILQSSEFFQQNSVPKPTNMYFFLKPRCGALGTALNEHFQVQSSLRLPSTCKITQLNIQTTGTDAVLGQPFRIFNDDACDDREPAEKESNEIYELDVVVKGFKEKFSKGKSWLQ